MACVGQKHGGYRQPAVAWRRPTAQKIYCQSPARLIGIVVPIIDKQQHLQKQVDTLLKGINRSGALGAAQIVDAQRRPTAGGRPRKIPDRFHITLSAPQRITEGKVDSLRSALRTTLKGFNLQHDIVLGPILQPRPSYDRTSTFLSVDMAEESNKDFDQLVTAIDEVMDSKRLDIYRGRYSGSREDLKFNGDPGYYQPTKVMEPWVARLDLRGLSTGLLFRTVE